MDQQVPDLLRTPEGKGGFWPTVRHWFSSLPERARRIGEPLDPAGSPDLRPARGEAPSGPAGAG